MDMKNFDFDVVIGSHGDVYDRMMCRFEESIQSIKIIRQAMKNMPEGPINVYAPNVATLKKRCLWKY